MQKPFKAKEPLFVSGFKMPELSRQEQRKMKREQMPSSKTKASMDWQIIVPVIVAGFGIAEIVFLSSIEPLNYAFALIVFVFAGIMFKQYFSRAELPQQPAPKQAFEQEEEQAVSGVLGKMDLLKGIEQSSSKDEKESFNLDDFLKSFPEKAPEQKSKKFSELMEESKETEMEDKLVEIAKQKQQQKKQAVKKEEPKEVLPMEEEQEEPEEKDESAVSFQQMKESTLKELKELAKKKKKEEEEEEEQ